MSVLRRGPIKAAQTERSSFKLTNWTVSQLISHLWWVQQNTRTLRERRKLKQQIKWLNWTASRIKFLGDPVYNMTYQDKPTL
jgi:hypothetical protein